ASNRSSTVNYVVHNHDTLIAIAHKFGVSVNAIKKSNNLDNSRIYVGQHLRIHPNMINYTVKRNDTLSGIAKNFCVSVQTITQANGLHGSLIYVGQQLRIDKVN